MFTNLGVSGAIFSWPIRLINGPGPLLGRLSDHMRTSIALSRRLIARLSITQLSIAQTILTFIG